MNREHNERGAPVQDVRGCNDSISVFSDANASDCGWLQYCK